MPSWIDLSDISGLPIRVNRETLELDRNGLVGDPPAARDVSEVRAVMLEPNAQVTPPTLYYMHRDLRQDADTDKLHSRDLRYDITIMRGGTLGPELLKTHGHYHPQIPGKLSFYPEVYEVLYGTAWYLMQKVGSLDDPANTLQDVILVEAHPGDKVVMLPGYGHITINPDPNQILVMSDFTGSCFSTLFPPAKQTAGGAYYVLAKDRQVVPNNRYSSIPPLRRAQAKPVPELGLESGLPLYTSGSRNPDRLKWLLDPDAYGGDWAKVLCFS
jgi:glucose-6-phosphate isomerase